MGSTTIALTTTFTTTATSTTTTSRTGTGQSGGGTSSSRGANASDAQTNRDAFDAALHRTGPESLADGGLGGLEGLEGPGGPGGPGGPRGGAPAPVPIAHLVSITANANICIIGSPLRIFKEDR
jgi:hypothetical protein